MYILSVILHADVTLKAVSKASTTYVALITNYYGIESSVVQHCDFYERVCMWLELLSN